MAIRPARGAARVPSTAIIGEYCVLGYPKEARLRAHANGTDDGGEPQPVIVGERCLLFNHVIVYEGAEIGDDCVIEDRVRIGYNSTVGPRTRVIYGAFICDRVTIGADARVAGFICDGTVIGARATVMGELVHEYSRPHLDWNDTDEDPPLIEDDTVVGFGARVIGGVRIGPRSYVAAGAVVTRDVPPEHVVTGVNQHTPAARWPGRRLRSLIEHWAAGDNPPERANRR